MPWFNLLGNQIDNRNGSAPSSDAEGMTDDRPMQGMQQCMRRDQTTVARCQKRKCEKALLASAMR